MSKFEVGDEVVIDFDEVQIHKLKLHSYKRDEIYIVRDVKNDSLTVDKAVAYNYDGYLIYTIHKDYFIKVSAAKEKFKKFYEKYYNKIRFHRSTM